MTGEFAFIDAIRRLFPDPPAGEVWIGDDCAVLAGGLLLALDTMVEGTHFDLGWCQPADVGWKAVAANVSDVAAMGGRPVAAVVGLTAPAGGGYASTAEAIGAGLAEAAGALACPMVGGDTTSGGDRWVVSVAILGRLPDGAPPLLRSGAAVGDLVFVTGEVGGARRALRSLQAGPGAASDATLADLDRLHRPHPRLAECGAARAGGATAMIDISDGLAADLGHILDASGVGVALDRAAVPRPPGVSPEEALAGGDDYELCFTAPDAATVAKAFGTAGLPGPTAVGRIVPAADGDTLPAAGFEHQL